MNKFMTFEELEVLTSEMDADNELEDNGMSGLHYGYHWYTLKGTNGDIELYVK